MIFAEIPVDSKLINEMFGKTPAGTHIKEIREDFEEFNKELFVEDIDTKINSIENLQYYKTELFRSYCMGLLSVLTKVSKFNQKVSNELNRQ